MTEQLCCCVQCSVQILLLAVKLREGWSAVQRRLGAVTAALTRVATPGPP